MKTQSKQRGYNTSIARRPFLLACVLLFIIPVRAQQELGDDVLQQSRFRLVRAQQQALGDDVSKAVERMLAVFPESNLQDFYKSCFQERFGTGHLVGTERRQDMIDYINRECRYMVEQEGWTSENDRLPRWEDAGLHGDYVRVNLSVVLDSLVSAETLADCFMRGAFAIDSAQIVDWQQDWNEIMVYLQPYRDRLGNFAADSAAIQDLFRKGEYAYHHSTRFNAAYHYHYRLIRDDIFIKELLFQVFPELLQQEVPERQKDSKKH